MLNLKKIDKKTAPRLSRSTERVRNNAETLDLKTVESETLEKAARLKHLRQIIATAEKQDIQKQSSGNTKCPPSQPAPKQDQTSSPLSCRQLGLSKIDDAYLGAPLDQGGLYHITGASYAHRTAATGFCLSLLARLQKQQAASPGSTPQAICLWGQTHKNAQEDGVPFGPGLLSQGLDPANFIFVSAPKDIDILWAMEEGLKAGGMTAIIGEVTDPSFTATRRLALASTQAQIPSFLIHTPTGHINNKNRATIKKSHQPEQVLFNSSRQTASAATSRWQIAALPSTPHPWDNKAPGYRNWHLELVRHRGGRPGSFNLEWNRETHTFNLAAAAFNRKVETTTHPTQQKQAELLVWKQSAQR